nr:hypothetical protein [Tanacetum cinerariifolium]
MAQENYVEGYYMQRPPLLEAVRAKATTIKEANDLATLPLDELTDNLKVYEMVLEHDGVVSKTTKEKFKSLALKANVTSEQNSDNNDSQDGSDEDKDEDKNKEKVHLLSHSGFRAFQFSSEILMMIYGGNVPILEVLFLHFYPLDQLKYGGIELSLVTL